MADGAAKVPLVDAVELVGGGEVHRLDDVMDRRSVGEPPLGLREPRVFLVLFMLSSLP